MRSSLALLLLLVLSACALPQQRSRTFDPYEPLQAYITTTTSSGPLFHVNRPAYVAMFYIVPGSGVSMLYPGFGSGSLSGRVFAGAHFANSRLGNRSQYVFTGSSYGQPRYYFLIASDRPLNVEQFGPFGDGLLSRLGSSFASYSAYSTMADLARLSLPTLADDGSWTTDLYVDWPSVIYTDPGRGRVLVRCGNYEMYVARGYHEVVRSMMCERDAESDRGEADPDGGEATAKPTSPGTRDPLPAEPAAEGADEIRTITAAQRAAIRERVSASSQLGSPTRRDEVSGSRGEFGQTGNGSRARPSPSAGASSSSAGRSVPSGSARPSAPTSRPASPPSAAPTSPSGGSGAVSAPSSRPSGGGGGGEAPSRGRSSPGG